MSRLETRDERGITLVELIVIISLMGLVLSLMLTIFVSSIRTQNDVQNAVGSTSSAQNAAGILTRDVRTASAIAVPTASLGTRLDIRMADGTCKAWYVSNNKLYSVTSTTKIAASPVTPATTSTTKLVLDPVNVITGSLYFTLNGNGVQYALKTGADIGRADLVGVISPRVATVNTSPCI